MSDFEPRIRRALGDLAASASADAHEADLWQRTQGRITRRRRRARGALAGLAVMAVLVPALGIPALTRDDDPRRVVAGPGEGRVDPSMPRRIAAVTTDGRLLVIDSSTGEVEEELEPSFEGVEYAFVSAAPNGMTLFLGAEDRGDGLIYRRGLASGEEAWVASGTWPSVSPDGRLLAYVTPGTYTGYVGYAELRVIDLQTRAERTWPLDPDDPTATIVAPPRWSPDGSHLAIGAITENGGLLLFDVDSDTYVGQAQAVRPAHYIDSIVDYLGRTGELLGVSEVDTEAGSRSTEAKPQRIVAMDAITGEVTRDLFELNLLHGPVVTPHDLLADPTGRHVLAVDVQGKLHRWSEGEDGATELAKGIVAAAWIPDPGPPTTTTSTTTPDTSAGDAWQMLLEAPIAGRSDAAAVWTGTEMIVWGGQGQRDGALDDGAAYNPSNRTWRTIAPAPISRRAPATAVWTGTEMIVWGDQDRSGSGGAGRDGAAYDPATDSWRRIAFAPVESTDAHWGIWTGDEMLVAGYDPVSEDMALAAYDPAEDVWREVAVPESGPPDAVWTGTELLVWFPAPGGEGGPVPNHGYALGEDGSWRRLADPPPTEPAIDIFPFVPLAWTGEVVIGKRHYNTQVYDPATDTYAEGEGGWGWVRGVDVWTGGVVLDWGGSEREGDSYQSTGVAYDPGSDTVTPLPPSPLEGRQSPAAVWTGAEMLVWGGIGDRPGGMSPDTWFADGAAYRPLDTTPPTTGPSTPAATLVVTPSDVAGWWDGEAWHAAADGPVPASGGEEYQVLVVGEPVRSATGGPPYDGCELNSEPGIEVEGLERDSGDGSAPPHAVAISGVDDVVPRPVEVIDGEPATYVDAAIDVMNDLGVDDPKPRLVQVVKADLDGDGTDEVLVAADHGTVGWPGVAPQDTSVLFLRRIVGGEIRTDVIASKVAVQAPEDPVLLPHTRMAYRVGAVADMNGDGRMEIAVTWRYYEGSGTDVYELTAAGPERVLTVGCGA